MSNVVKFPVNNGVDILPLAQSIENYIMDNMGDRGMDEIAGALAVLLCNLWDCMDMQESVCDFIKDISEVLSNEF